MQYADKYFYLCSVPLGAEEPKDVSIVTRAENSSDFPRVFKKYEDLRAHAFNEDKLFSVIRADEIHVLIRTTTTENAKEMAFEESKANVITNLQHRVMQNNDANAREILKKVHQIELSLS